MNTWQPVSGTFGIALALLIVVVGVAGVAEQVRASKPSRTAIAMSCACVMFGAALLGLDLAAMVGGLNR